MEIFISKQGLLNAAKAMVTDQNIPASARLIGRRVRSVAKGSRVGSQGWQGWFDVNGQRIPVEA